MSSTENTIVMDAKRKDNIMTNKSKKKGTAAESKIVKYLQEQGFDCERIALHGVQDRGDIVIHISDKYSFVLEVKAGKQTQNYSRATKEKWLKQARQESNNYACFSTHEITAFPYLIIVGYNKPFKDAEVWYQIFDSGTAIWEMDRFCYMNEFPSEIKSWLKFAKEKKGGE